MKIRCALPLLILLVCITRFSPADARPLQITASFSILGDIVQQVGGTHVEVTVLVGANGDVHSYEASPKDVAAIEKADLIVLNGLNFEPWLEKLAASLGREDRLVTASQGIEPLFTEDHAHGHAHEADPHAWQDIANGMIYVRNIEAALIAADPAHASDYRTGTETYIRRLSDLDAWTRATLSAVPEEKRKIITTHKAFGYFARAYGIHILTPGGTAGGGEPSAGDVARLIRQVRAAAVKALFVENMNDPRIMEVVARETGATMGGKLYSDALSPANGEAPTYEAMFRSNVPKLKAAMLKN